MNTKLIAFVMIVGLSLVLATGIRTTNRADAAVGNCYAADWGTSTPTICE